MMGPKAKNNHAGENQKQINAMLYCAEEDNMEYGKVKRWRRNSGRMDTEREEER
jgi:hypothetical protein